MIGYSREHGAQAWRRVCLAGATALCAARATPGAWLVAVVTLLPATASAVSFEAGGTTFTFSGYVQGDVIYSNYGAGNIPSTEFGSDFYLPFAIPTDDVAANAADGKDQIDVHARESRFIFETETDLSGNALTSYLEMDFFSFNDAGGNETYTNSYNPRVRHFFFTFNNLLVGQTWSTFMNTGALAETLDFVGPAESTVFIRQAQVRYTAGPFQFALENPQPRIYPVGGPADGSALGGETDTHVIPDVVGRYDLPVGEGALAFAALGRFIEVDETVGDVPVDDDTFGYGLSFSGAFPVGTDTVTFAVNGGDGIGRYLGFGGGSAVAQADGSLESVLAYGAFGSYQHWWADKWRSNLVLGFYRQDDDEFADTSSAIDEAKSAHINLLYSPVEEVTFGVEYLYADRENVNGGEGDLNRVQFSGIYAF